MKEEFTRTAALLGEEAIAKLNSSYVALFGLGGVGSYTAEALARAGIGKILLIDSDKVSKSNINRQLCALQSTVGRYKADVIAERLLDINPDIIIEKRYDFVLPENIDTFDFSSFDYVIDAIDTVSAKVHLIKTVKEAGVPIISAMGAGGKLDPTKFEVSDIYKTSVCPLARVMRQELKKCGIKSLKVVYSKEEGVKKTVNDTAFSDKVTHRAPGSISFVPSVMGLIIAGEVIKDVVGIK